MQFTFLLAACLLAAVASAMNPAADPLVLDRKIELTGGDNSRLDHLVADFSSNRLFVSSKSNGSVAIIDLQQNVQIGAILGPQQPQGECTTSCCV